VKFTAIDNASEVQTQTVEYVVTGEGENLEATAAITDGAGNYSIKKITGIKIDRTKPTIHINGALASSDIVDIGTHTLNSSVGWTAQDSLSGLASPSSGTIDTSTPGEHAAKLTAVDNAGNTVEKIISYKVEYNFGGILQPINSSGSSLFKNGGTVPVKFQLRDADAFCVTDALAKIYIAKVTDNVVGTEEEAESTSLSSVGNIFRYDGPSNQYIFNLSTKELSQGTYQIRINLDDGTDKKVTISIKK
jgi:hypothetical protein